jgi:hypothetical protein
MGRRRSRSAQRRQVREGGDDDACSELGEEGRDAQPVRCGPIGVRANDPFDEAFEAEPSECRLRATQDQVAAGFASGMGPPPLPVIGPPEGPPTPTEKSLGWVSHEEPHSVTH